MVTRDFTYRKDEGVKQYSVIILKDSSASFEGISLENLSEDDTLKVKEIFKEFEAKLYPFVKKGWRKFTNDKVVKILNEEKSV